MLHTVHDLASCEQSIQTMICSCLSELIISTDIYLPACGNGNR